MKPMEPMDPSVWSIPSKYYKPFETFSRTSFFIVPYLEKKRKKGGFLPLGYIKVTVC